MATASDDYNRANSADLGTTWDTQTGTSAMRVNTNAARNIGTGTMSAETWNANTFGNDQFAQGTAANELETQAGLGSEYGIGPAVRMSTADQSKYAAIISADAARDLQLLKFDGTGVITVLGTYTAGTPALGDVIRIEAQGTTIRVLQNGVERISVTDSTLTSGRVGLCGRQSVNQPALDDWSGGDLGVFSIPAPLLGSLFVGPHRGGIPG